MNVHTISRLPSATYIIQRTLSPETVGSDKAHKAHWPVAQAIVDALHDAGWRLVPGRAPTSRSHENSQPPLIEGEITTRQLIDIADVFDEIDEELFTASDFIYWLAPDVRGSAEWEWLAKRRLG